MTTPDQDNIYRTVYMVEVLSQGPFNLNDDDESDLTQIDYEISYGDCIGQVRKINSVAIPPDQVQEALLSIGNDGTFFDKV